eukprot:TRINITY_DN16409_c0_g2_i1.p1 TRINITY_DN16409_c0_g2~~TRINITY_DN16409_c0_g2_i1.p1  ORF type:complete len:446 (-),score=47.46 TRINITY_DN16409_c0_g2_i1:392-1729(-)
MFRTLSSRLNEAQPPECSAEMAVVVEKRAGTCPPDVACSFVDEIMQEQDDGDFMEEFALQGRLFKRTFTTGISTKSNVFKSSLRTDRKERIKYSDSQVLNYNAMSCARADTVALTFEVASVLRQSELLKDVCFTISFAVPFTWVFYNYCGNDSDEVFKDRMDDFSRTTTSMHGVLTFLLGFYLSTAVSRWWAIRNDCIGGLWGAVSDLSLQLAAYFPSDSRADRGVRSRILRWGVLSHELVYKQARGETDLEDLLEAKLLTDHEWELLENEPSKPQVVWVWVSSYLTHLAYGSEEDGGGRLPYPAQVLPQLQSMVCSARGSIGAAFGYTDTQVPFSYVQFLGLLTWVHNLIQVIASANVASSYLHGKARKSTALMEMVFVVLYPTFFLAILHLCNGLLNPLRSSSYCFPKKAYTQYMLGENVAFHKAASKPPYGAPPTWFPAASR